LYNALGQLVQTMQLSPVVGPSIELDLSGLPSGTYIFKIGTAHSIRVVKE